MASLPSLRYKYRRCGSSLDLVGRRADDGFDVDPVGAPAEIGLHAMVGTMALEYGHHLLLAQSIFLAIVGIRDFALYGIANHRGNGIVEKRAILNDGRITHFVLESARVRLDVDMHGAAF